MKKIGLLIILNVVLVISGISLSEGALDVMTVMKKSEAALDDMRSGTRKIIITLKDGERVTNKWVARRAHKVFSDGKRELMVILEPEDLKGNAYMYWKPNNQPTIEWVYSIPTRRVRKLAIPNAYESFFGTDFTYADLDIKDPAGTYKLLAEEEYIGIKTYKVETTPKEKWYYSRIVSLIAGDTFLPLKRDYYDASGRLWKTKLFENIAVINNIPIPLRVRMLDLQRDHSTEVVFSDVCFDADYLSKETFDPEKLPEAPLSPVCAVPLPKK